MRLTLKYQAFKYVQHTFGFSEKVGISENMHQTSANSLL